MGVAARSIPPIHLLCMFFPALCGRRLHPRPPAIINQLHLPHVLQDVILISTFPRLTAIATE